MKYDAEREFWANNRKQFWAQRYKWAPRPPESYAALEGEIDAAAVDRVISIIESAPDAPLHLQINSPGGNVADGWRLYNRLRQLPAPVSTCAAPQCSSAALLPLLAGDQRLGDRQAHLLIHAVACEPTGRPAAALLRGHVEALEALDAEFRLVIAARARRYPAWALERDMAGDGTILDATTALGFGLLTQII